MTNTKQLKITKLFGKGASKFPEDCDDLQEEIQQLEQSLKDKQDDLLSLQRNSYRHKKSLPKLKTGTFIRPQRATLISSVESLKQSLDLISMLTGIEVQSYILDDHCCITYNMQHDAEYQTKHGLRIELKSGSNEVSKSSLPLGFNLQAVMEDFDNIMIPECLGAIKRALVAYYDRQEQFEALKKLLNIEAQLFKILDASHIEISFVAQNDQEEDAEQFDIVLMLDYRIYDIRPKLFSFKEIDLPEGVPDILRAQCMVFKKKPLHKAFKEAFLDGIGPYSLVEQVGVRPVEQRTRRHKRFKPDKNYYNKDDTFHPEECPEAAEPSDDSD